MTDPLVLWLEDGVVKLPQCSFVGVPYVAGTVTLEPGNVGRLMVFDGQQLMWISWVVEADYPRVVQFNLVYA